MVPARAGRPRSPSGLCLALALAALVCVECRTPPPLSRTPPEPALAGETPAPAPPPEPTPPAAAVVPHEPPPAETEFRAEQVELKERYASRRALAVLRGEASYYGAAFAGRRTANGEIFEPRRFTAAHRTLPFGTILRVTRLDNGAVVYVRVNDRGPFGRKRRIIDLSQAAAESLGMLRRGVAEVRAEIVERGKPPSRSKKRRRI